MKNYDFLLFLAETCCLCRSKSFSALDIALALYCAKVAGVINEKKQEHESKSMKVRA